MSARCVSSLRPRAHRRQNCQTPRRDTGICELCPGFKHSRTSCARQWRQYKLTPASERPVRPPGQALVRGCYNCGDNTHFGCVKAFFGRSDAAATTARYHDGEEARSSTRRRSRICDRARRGDLSTACEVRRTPVASLLRRAGRGDRTSSTARDRAISRRRPSARGRPRRTRRTTCSRGGEAARRGRGRAGRRRHRRRPSSRRSTSCRVRPMPACRAPRPVRARRRRRGNTARARPPLSSLHERTAHHLSLSSTRVLRRRWPSRRPAHARTSRRHRGLATISSTSIARTTIRRGISGRGLAWRIRIAISRLRGAGCTNARRRLAVVAADRAGIAVVGRAGVEATTRPLDLTVQSPSPL